MDSFDGLDLNVIFKAANLAVGSLAVLSGLSQLFSGLQAFIIGVYIIAFGAIINILEFSIPSEAQTYGLFLFSFVGRGVFYTLIGASVNGASWFRLLASLLIFVVGLVYIVLEAVPSISPPDNMNPEGISIGAQDEDIV